MPTEKLVAVKKPFVWTVPLVNKIDFQILPIFCIFYLLSSLDRSSAQFSEISGLTTDLNISSAQQTQWATAAFYFCVIIFDIPSNIILRRWKPCFWLAIIMGSWGTISTAMAACSDFNGLVVARLVLSICEAGFFPGVVFYLSFWYTRKELGKRLGILWGCRCLAGGIGGLFAYGVSFISSTKQMHIWQWTFILQGSPCVIIALITSWYLPNDPETTSFLLHQESRIITRKLEADVGHLNENDWSWDQLGTVLTDLKTYAFILIYLLGAASVQGVTLLLPTAISKLNMKSVLQSQILMLPPYLLAIFVTLAITYSSDHFYERSFHIVGLNAVSIIGFLALVFFPAQQALGSYIVLCIVVATIYAHVAIKITWIANSFSGYTRRTVALGMVVSIGSIGGAIGSQILYNAPNYTGGKVTILSLIVAQSVVVLITRSCMIRESLRRKKMNMDAREYQLYKHNGEELAGDRHPDFQYTI